MQKIFLDTNVILDFVLHRDGEIQAMDILQMGEDEKISLCTSFLSMANIAYILRKLPQKELYRMLSLLTSMFDVLPMTKEYFTKALQIENVDFEDVLQYVCAKENKCDVIVTSNKKHFLFSEVQICSPNEFLSRNK